MEFGNLVISIMARGGCNGGIGAQAHKTKRIIFIVQKMPMPIKGVTLRRLFSSGEMSLVSEVGDGGNCVDRGSSPHGHGMKIGQIV